MTMSTHPRPPRALLLASVLPLLLATACGGGGVTSAAGTCHLKDSKGLRYLAQLVASPGREIHALELASPGGEADRGDAGEAIDRRSRDAYRARLADLADQLREAEDRHDLGRAAAARAEIDALTDELARSLGMGGRARKDASPAERARVAVQRRIKDAIARLESHDPGLAKHLARSVRTGAFCRYEPG
jgi:non-specific serine/threonine protein kinase